MPKFPDFKPEYKNHKDYHDTKGSEKLQQGTKTVP
jgi:hypothetical protein